MFQSRCGWACHRRPHAQRGPGLTMCARRPRGLPAVPRSRVLSADRWASSIRPASSSTTGTVASESAGRELQPRGLVSPLHARHLHSGNAHADRIGVLCPRLEATATRASRVRRL